MDSFSQYVIPITVVFAAMGILFVVGMTYFERRQRNAGMSKGGALEAPCSVCHRLLSVHKNNMTKLSSAEIGLIVSVHPGVQGRPLAEYQCPYCKASHTYATDTRPPEWISADTFQPGHAGGHCVNCSKTLQNPPWPPGAYDGKVLSAPDLGADHGLVCSRCAAVCCAECVKDVTRNRTKDGSLLCPRCYRSPVDKVYHF